MELKEQCQLAVQLMRCPVTLTDAGEHTSAALLHACFLLELSVGRYYKLPPYE